MSGTSQDVEAAAAAIGTLLMVAGTLRGVITSARQRAADAARDRATFGDQQFEAGARSRDDEVRQLRSERDDARAERREALADAREWRAQALKRDGKG